MYVLRCHVRSDQYLSLLPCFSACLFVRLRDAFSWSKPNRKFAGHSKGIVCSTACAATALKSPQKRKEFTANNFLLVKENEIGLCVLQVQEVIVNVLRDANNMRLSF
jgi:hypothetical protein